MNLKITKSLPDRPLTAPVSMKKTFATKPNTIKTINSDLFGIQEIDGKVFLTINVDELDGILIKSNKQNFELSTSVDNFNISNIKGNIFIDSNHKENKSIRLNERE